jgi:hypothetical protein
MSRNAHTVAQLQLACRHVEEMVEAGVSVNFSIRTPELFADVRAKRHMEERGRTHPAMSGRLISGQLPVPGREDLDMADAPFAQRFRE